MVVSHLLSELHEALGNRMVSTMSDIINFVLDCLGAWLKSIVGIPGSFQQWVFTICMWLLSLLFLLGLLVWVVEVATNIYEWISDRNSNKKED